MKKYKNIEVEYRPVDSLIPYARNPRKNDDAAQKLAGVIAEFGFAVPVIIRSTGEIIDGHARLKAAQILKLKEVPVIVNDEWTEAQAKAFRLAVNKSAEWAEWDDELLKLELDELKLEDFDLELIGFDDVQVQEATTEGLTDPDEVPEVPEQTISRNGDIWLLGKHRLMCGDSTDAGSVALLMAGEKADLLLTDPPYGMGKQKDGVLNDNQNAEELQEFNKKWVPVSFANTKENGSWYCWGTDEGLVDLYAVVLFPMVKKKEIVFRNFITWEKDSVMGMNTPGDRQFHPITEHCLFFMIGSQSMQVFCVNACDFSPKMQPVLDYLKGEAERLGLTPKLCKEITGFSDMYKHWFSTSQFSIPTEKSYKKLQEYYKKNDGFKREYDDLKREYDDLKREFYAGRAYFDAKAENNVTDVWHFNKTSGKERESCGGHATPKPIALCKRGVCFSCPEEGIVLDLFGGSGSTLIACEQTGRQCRMMELSERYVDVIVRRWQEFTGQEATLEGDGRTFAEIADERG